MLNGKLSKISNDEDQTVHYDIDRYMASVEDNELTVLDWWKKSVSLYLRNVVVAKDVEKTCSLYLKRGSLQFDPSLLLLMESILDPQMVHQLLF